MSVHPALASVQFLLGTWEGAGKGVYSYTFTQPGTYPYHCTVHPQEMRGTVVVK